jgi:CheY-like chemotaxis protein
LGVEVDTAGSGHGGWSLVQEKRIDLALIDLCLPDMSGLELARRLREQHISVPWILMSGFMDYDAAREAGALGAIRAVALPTDLAELVSRALEDLGQTLVWPALPIARRLRKAGTSAEHWAHLVLQACDSERDLPTLREWAACVAKSYSRLAEASRIIRIDPHDARDFMRILRVLLHSDGRVAGIESLLNVADYRTLARLMERAGLANSQPRLTPAEWIHQQHFISADHPAVLAVLEIIGE